MKNIKILMLLVLLGVTQVEAQVAPGGVTSNLALWLKADLGTSTTADNQDVSSWNNQALNPVLSVDQDQMNTDAQPHFQENSINFNPSLFFDGVDDVLLDATTSALTKSDESTVFVVSLLEGISRPGGELSFNNIPGNLPARFSYYSNRFNLQFFDLMNFSAGRVSISAQVPLGQVGLSGFHNSVANSFREISSQGVSVANKTTGIAFDANGTYIGNTLGTEFFKGKIAEIVVHAAALTSTEKDQIESYLALKYGITLDQNIAAQSYLASNASTIWDNVIGATYNQDIFGLGRDNGANGSSLDQRISKSVNANTVLTASSDTNFVNENSIHTSILDDLEFVTHANNAAGVALAVSADAINTNYANIKKVNRVWQIQEVGDVGCINYKFDVSNITFATGDVLFVVIADDAAFTTNISFEQLNNLSAETRINWPANTSTNYMTLAVLKAADITTALTDVKVGMTTLNTKPLPTTANTYLELMSENTGFVITRVTTTNRATMTQQSGLFVFDTDLNQFFVSDGTAWRVLGDTKFCN